MLVAFLVGLLCTKFYKDHMTSKTYDVMSKQVVTRTSVKTIELNDRNYKEWHLFMTTALQQEGLIGAIEAPMLSSDPINRDALVKILSSVPHAMRVNISNSYIAFELMESIEKQFSTLSYEKEFLLREEICSTQLDKFDRASINKHIELFQQRVEQLRSFGTRITQRLVMIMFSKTLPQTDEWLSIRDSISASQMSMEEVAYVLQEKGKSLVKSSFLVNYSKPRQFRNDVQRRDYEKGLCFRCHKQGHQIRNCTVNLTKINDTSAYLFNRSFLAVPMQNGEYLLDSGSTDHHVASTQALINVTRGTSDNVLTASGEKCPIIGKGNLNIQTLTGNLSLKNVKVTPDFEANLISVAKLTDEGLEVLFKRDAAYVYQNEQMIHRVPRVGNLYLHKEMPCHAYCAPLSTSAHDQFGHPSDKKMEILKKQYPELSWRNHSDCEPCIQAKLRQNSYSTTNTQIMEPLEVIHIDLDDAKERGYDGSQYLVIIVDDYSRYMEAIPIKTKSANTLMQVFIEFKKRMELQIGKKVKAVRTDNGREFLGDFDAYLKDNGIIHQTTVPYCHQQNGLVERHIQTLNNKIRALMIKSCMPTRYWPIAAKAAATVYNLIPHTALKDQSPFKTLFPNTKNLIERGGKLATFGCKAYRRIHPERMCLDRAGKFDPVATSLIYVGHEAPYSDAYLLLDPKTDKVIKERNVRFLDGQFPFCNKDASKCQCQQPESDVTVVGKSSPSQIIVIAETGQEYGKTNLQGVLTTEPESVVDHQSPVENIEPEPLSNQQPSVENHEPNSVVNLQIPVENPEPELFGDPQPPVENLEPELFVDLQTPVENLEPELFVDLQPPVENLEPELFVDLQPPVENLEPELFVNPQLPVENPEPELFVDPQPLVEIFKPEPSLDRIPAVETSESELIADNPKDEYDIFENSNKIVSDENSHAIICKEKVVSREFKQNVPENVKTENAPLPTNELDNTNMNSEEVEVLSLRDRNVDRRPVRLGIVNPPFQPRTGNKPSEALSSITIENPTKVKIPKTHEEAMASDWATYWRDAELEELKCLLTSRTFEEIDKNKAKSRPISCKWVYTLKRNPTGTIKSFKARLVCRGFEQVEGVDFNETFAPTVTATSIRIFLAVAKAKKMLIHQIDVKSAFLYGELKEQTYVIPPKPFKSEGKVWLLHKALYGLRQAPRVWSEKVANLLAQVDFHPTKTDKCIFTRKDEYGIHYLLVYVDDILIASNEIEHINKIKQHLKNLVTITDMGEISRFLGVDFRNISPELITMSQEKYIDELSKKFKIEKANKQLNLPSIETLDLEKEPIRNDVPLRELIGALLFIANLTRPDIAAAVSYLSRYLDRPHPQVWNMAKKVLIYLQSTKGKVLVIGNRDGSTLEAYADASYATQKDRKSQTGCVLRLLGSTIGWQSRKQKTVSTSSTEAEYIALSHTATEVLWAQNLLWEMDFPIKYPTRIWEDNQPAIAISTNNKNPRLAKHIDIKWHAIQDYVKRFFIEICHIPSREQLADALTKVNTKGDVPNKLLGYLPFPEVQKSEGMLNI